MVNDGELVFPGTMLSTVEEFSAGKGTYEDEGAVYSSVIGTVKFDPTSRSVSIAPKGKIIPELRAGDIVLGRVFGLKEQVLLVEVFCKEDNTERVISTQEIAGVHISRVSDRYVKDLESLFKEGDILRARVTELEPQLSLETRDSKYGVLKAYCSVCGDGLERKGNMLECNNCGNKEMRKIADDYGKGMR